jgi:hypothetical protein
VLLLVVVVVLVRGLPRNGRCRCLAVGMWAPLLLLLLWWRLRMRLALSVRVCMHVRMPAAAAATCAIRACVDLAAGDGERCSAASAVADVAAGYDRRPLTLCMWLRLQ